MPEKSVDFAAAGRVAKRVELKNVRLIEVSAKCDPSLGGPLEPNLNFDCAVVSRKANALEIGCDYRFTARTSEAQVAEAAIKYILVYEVSGSEPLEDEDITQFAFGNGTLHSWPFLREFLYGLTSRMGYLPYMLPVLHFTKPPKKEVGGEKETATQQQDAPESTK